jgi:DNA-directed RNA polymerase subunit H
VSDEVSPQANRFNVLNHDNVPLHELLAESEAKALLSKYGIVREQLPKIRSSDPVIGVLAKAANKAPQELGGAIVRITRRSPTAGVAVAYRLVIEAI